MNGYFTPDLGTVDSAICDVCSSKCNVTRNVKGYRGKYAAMANNKSKFDIFSCPHMNEEWHNKAFTLICEYKRTKFPSIRSLMRQDINDFIFEHTELLWMEVKEPLIYKKVEENEEES